MIWDIFKTVRFLLNPDFFIGVACNKYNIIKNKQIDEKIFT